MSTTTIRLPEDLKVRLSKAAERAGLSAHSFILQAIAEKADQEERRAEFDALADGRFARLLASGETLAWEDVRLYLLKRAADADHGAH